ncbi:MAG: discoidin domain-containing protein [bacterium]|nr:discoidin domain-containing protein [bacterium]
MGKQILKHNQSGFALLFVFFFVILVAGIVLGYINMNSQSTANVGAKQTEMQAFYAAEAAQARAVQYLQLGTLGIWNTIQPNNWNQDLGLYSQTETMGTSIISYDFIVDNWNLVYSGNPAPFAGVSVTSVNALGLPDVQPVTNLIDGNQATDWQTQNNPGIFPITLTLQFPNNSNYTLNEIRIRRQGTGRPTAYTWSTSTDGVIYTAAIPFTSDGAGNEWCDFFNTPAVNVNFLRMTITGATGNRVQIREMEVPWIRIKSRCRISSTTGSSFTEKYIRSCVLTSKRSVPPLPAATIYKIVPSNLPGTNITAIWDEIPLDTYNDATQF